jgi:CRISPR/Cas system-associated protein endoribonuclease Cas2
MKRILIIIAFFAIPLILKAQNTPVDALFDKYAGKEGFTTVYITKYMFDMFRSKDSKEKDADDINRILGKLNSIKILAVEDSSVLGKGVNFYKEIMKDLPREKYNELMVVKDKESDVVFLAREDKGVIVELLLIAGGAEASSNVLICIQGQINLEDISKLTKTLDIEGMEPLEDFDK